MPADLTRQAFEAGSCPGHGDFGDFVIGDAMDGDAMLFAREDGVEAAWTVVQGVLDNVVPAIEYEAGSWGPAEAANLAADIGGWHDPA